MMLKLALALSVIFAPCVVARDLAIDEPDIDFGEAYQFSSVVRDVHIWNNSDQTVTVEPTKLSGPGEAHLASASIAPRSSALLHLEIPLGQSVGLTSSRFVLQSGMAGKKEQYAVRVHGYVHSVLDSPNPKIELGFVDAEKADVEKALELTSFKEPAIRATKIIEAPSFVSASIAPDGKKIILRAAAHNSTLGMNEGAVRVALNSRLQSQVSIAVSADFIGAVAAEPSLIDFGLRRMSSKSPMRVQLVSRDGNNFKVGGYSVDGAHLEVEAAECIGSRGKGCRAFLLTVSHDQPIGQIYGTITFKLPDQNATLRVGLAGLFISDDTKVEPLETLLEKKPGTSTGARVPLASALKQSVAPAIEHVDPPGKGPLLRWSVANESSIFGYAIYRGDSEQGPFSRVNESPVLAENAGDNTSAEHSWRDLKATPGRNYWYFIVVLHNSGLEERLSEPHSVTAK